MINMMVACGVVVLGLACKHMGKRAAAESEEVVALDWHEGCMLAGLEISLEFWEHDGSRGECVCDSYEKLTSQRSRLDRPNHVISRAT